MSRYVAVQIDGEVTIHIPHTYGNYATLCGLDGDDEYFSVNQKTVPTPKGKKVNCEACLSIWKTCQEYTKKDFE